MVQDALDNSKRHTAEILARVREDGKRADDEGLELHYSPEDDYLTVTVGEPRESVSIPAGVVYILVDPDSGKINALEVPFFVENFKSGKVEGDFWEIAYRLVEAGHSTVYIPAKKEQERAGTAFKDLVPA